MQGLISIDQNYKQTATMVPHVVEQDGRSERVMDSISMLLKHRIININEPITDVLAGVVIAQLLFLESDNSEAEININLQSPGGSCSAGFAIMDTIWKLTPTVNIIAMGMVASMGTMILLAATGKRMALENATILIHQPLGGSQGQASDIVIAANNIVKTKHLLYKIISKKTGQPYEKIEKDADRDFNLDSDSALEYGLIDEIIVGPRGRLLEREIKV